MPRKDKPIPLVLQLWDKDASKYVRATIRLPNGSQLTGSPIALQHADGGLYYSNAVPMPDSDFVSVFYEVFSDSGFTQPSPEHGEAFEVFEMTSGGDSFTSAMDDLVAVIDDAQIPLVATVEEARIFVGGLG